MPRLGRTMAVSIREATPGDAEVMLEHVHVLAAEPDVDVPLAPGELTVTVEEERRILRQYADAENSAWFTAWEDGRLLGMLDLRPSELPAGRHRAMLGMSVAAASRGRGVGRALLEHAIGWARASRLLTKISLDVYTRNAAALHLYESVGFEREGRRRAPIWEGEDPVDTYLMGLSFDEKEPVPYDLAPLAPAPVPRTAPQASVIVRDATRADASAAMALWRSIRADPSLLVPTAGLASVEPADAFRRRFETTLASENSHTLVAESGGELVGTISARGHDRRQMAREALVAIGVAEGWRGRGVGRRLLEEIAARAREGGILRRFTLFVYAENHAAIGLYESCGYEVEGMLRNAWFQQGRYHDELMMGRLL